MYFSFQSSQYLNSYCTLSLIKSMCFLQTLRPTESHRTEAPTNHYRNSSFTSWRTHGHTSGQSEMKQKRANLHLHFLWVTKTGLQPTLVDIDTYCQSMEGMYCPIHKNCLIHTFWLLFISGIESQKWIIKHGSLVFVFLASKVRHGRPVGTPE